MPIPKNPMFPRKTEDQVSDLNTKRTYLEMNVMRLNIPVEEMTIVATEIDDMNVKNEMARNIDARSKIDVAKRNLAIKTARTTMRRVIEFYIIGNPNATQVDYIALNIPIPGSHQLLPLPEHAPGIRKIWAEDLVVHINFFNAQSGRNAKPDGVQGIEAYFKIGEEPPTDVTQMTEHKVATSSPMRIQFGYDDEFKLLYLAFRWIGTRGDYGPWSEIKKTIIIR
jgi:hypothetical protein